MMKGIKGFSVDAEGKIFTHPYHANNPFYFKKNKKYSIEEGQPVIVCVRGFHFCADLRTTMKHYGFPINGCYITQTIYGEIRATGEIIKNRRKDGLIKYASNKIEIKKIFSNEEVLMMLKAKKIKSFTHKSLNLFSIEFGIPKERVIFNTPALYRKYSVAIKEYNFGILRPKFIAGGIKSCLLQGDIYSYYSYQHNKKHLEKIILIKKIKICKS